MRSVVREDLIFTKLDEVKVLRDPIHGYIHVSYKVIWDVINSSRFQRLRRIKQTGAAYIVYHTADHTRFAHSLGVYEIAQRMCYENKDINNATSEIEKITVMLAALLHDVGHGPFSHTFEGVINTSHEEYSMRIIEEGEIGEILESYLPGLSKQVSAIIGHTHPNVLLTSMISSQLDADRMDYLLRDAYFTGTKYGDYDLERVLRTLRVRDGRLLVKESGMHTIEDYIMARYHMYWQVYYHPVARSFECILHKLFMRMKEVYETSPDLLKNVEMFKHVLDGSFDLDDHYLLDEYACVYGFERLMHCEDKILSDLARRLINRDLFEYDDVNNVDIEFLKTKVKEAGYDEKYYIGYDEVRQSPYLPYKNKDERGILILMSDNSICELSKASSIVASLISGTNKNDYKVFVPKEVFE